jgi:hypothetical protein
MARMRGSTARASSPLRGRRPSRAGSRCARRCRLLVQQHALAAVEGRVEPEPAFGREGGLHHHVGDQEAVLEELPGEPRPPCGGCRCWRRRRRSPSRPPCGTRRRASRPSAAHGRPPAAGSAAGASSAGRHARARAGRDQRLFQVVLLQVDHRRHLVAGLGQQVEAGRPDRRGRTPCRPASVTPRRRSPRRRPGGPRSRAAAWRSRPRASRC